MIKKLLNCTLINYIYFVKYKLNGIILVTSKNTYLKYIYINNKIDINNINTSESQKLILRMIFFYFQAYDFFWIF